MTVLGKYSLGLAAAAALSATASGQVVVDFTGSAGFSGDFEGQVSTPGADGITIAGDGDFGGSFLTITPGSVGPFDNADSLEITLKVNDAGGAGPTDVLFLLLDQDDDLAATGEAYLYQVDLSLFSTTEFTTVNIGPIADFDEGPNGAFGRGPGDGVLNLGVGGDGLYEFQIQTLAGTPNFTVASVEVVPEPASAALLGLGGLAMLRRRK